MNKKTTEISSPLFPSSLIAVTACSFKKKTIQFVYFNQIQSYSHIQITVFADFQERLLLQLSLYPNGKSALAPTLKMSGVKC